ncbi:MAG: hypothetical protein ACREPA_07025 [Candidatus Dormibacteraceae bacterium]
MKHRILYAEITWRKQRLMPFVLLAAGAGMGVFTLVSRHGHVDSSVVIWLVYVPAALVILAGLHANRIRSYARATEAGVEVHRLFKSTLIDYDSIRSVKVQPLSQAYQNGRRRMVNQLTKPLLTQPALFIRLRGDEAQVAQISRALGSRFAFDGTAALPIPDAASMAGEIGPHLPVGAGANLGGGRRRKRRH